MASKFKLEEHLKYLPEKSETYRDCKEDLQQLWEDVCKDDDQKWDQMMKQLRIRVFPAEVKSDLKLANKQSWKDVWEHLCNLDPKVKAADIYAEPMTIDKIPSRSYRRILGRWTRAVGTEMGQQILFEKFKMRHFRNEYMCIWRRKILPSRRMIDGELLTARMNEAGRLRRWQEFQKSIKNEGRLSVR